MKLLAGLLFHNLVYKLVALLVAGVLWAAVQGSQSIELSLDLPIEIVDAPASLVVVDQSALEVNVRVVGSRAAVRAAERAVTRYPINLRGLSGAGEARFPVTADRLELPRGARVSARSPSTIVLQTEPVVRKKVPVRADVIGIPPEGFELVNVTVEPREVVLAGARSSIRQTREVLTRSVDVTDLRNDLVEEVPLASFGGSLVWRAEEDVTPVTVQIRVKPEPNGAEPGAGAPAQGTEQAAPSGPESQPS